MAKRKLLTDVEINKLSQEGFQEGSFVPGRGVLTPMGSFRDPREGEEGFKAPSPITRTPPTPAPGAPIIPPTPPRTAAGNFFLKDGKVIEIGDPSLNPQLTAGATRLKGANLAAARREAAALELAKNQGTATTTDAVVSTDDVVQGERDTVDEITSLQGDGSSFTNLTAVHDAAIADMESEAAKLDSQRKAEVSAINEQFEKLIGTTEGAQKRETGTFRVALARIGGFLGESASAVGAMRNLSAEHKAEISSIESRRGAAIQAANTAITNKEFELAREKVQEVKDFEQEIEDRRNTFFDQSLNLIKEQRQQDEQKTRVRNQVRDDARSILNTIITNFGGIDITQLDEATGQDFAELAALAGMPVEVLAQPTLKEKAQLSTEEQRAISNALSTARLQLQQSSFNLSLERFAESEKLNSVDAQRLGLPKSLVGVSENEVEEQLRDVTPPDWFVEIEEGKPDGAVSRTELNSRWEEFRTEILTTNPLIDFGGIGLPPAVEG